MDMEFTFMKMGNYFKVNGNMGKNKEKGLLNTKMGKLN